MIQICCENSVGRILQIEGSSQAAWPACDHEEESSSCRGPLSFANFLEASQRGSNPGICGRLRLGEDFVAGNQFRIPTD